MGHTHKCILLDFNIKLKTTITSFLSGMSSELRAPISKGSHLIIIHAESEDAFVNDALELF